MSSNRHVSADAPEPGLERSQQGTGGPGRRILVVDDSVDTAESFAELLRLKGHTVRTAHDGAAAVEICRELLPHVVFLDIGLPEMSGYELAGRLCAGTDHRPVLVAVTGYDRRSSQRRSREAGIRHHLTKPIDLPEVEEILRRLWQ